MPTLPPARAAEAAPTVAVRKPGYDVVAAGSGGWDRRAACPTCCDDIALAILPRHRPQMRERQ